MVSPWISRLTPVMTFHRVLWRSLQHSDFALKQLQSLTPHISHSIPGQPATQRWIPYTMRMHGAFASRRCTIIVIDFAYGQISIGLLLGWLHEL